MPIAVEEGKCSGTQLKLRDKDKSKWSQEKEIWITGQSEKLGKSKCQEIFVLVRMKNALVFMECELMSSRQCINFKGKYLEKRVEYWLIDVIKLGIIWI